MAKDKHNMALDDLDIKAKRQNDNVPSHIDQLENQTFRKNLVALFKQDEILAAKLFALNSQGDYEVFIGKDPIDINIINNKNLKYIYENPAKDVEHLLEETEKQYKRYPMMFFYGFGNGVFYKALAQNKTHKKIVIIEPNLEIIYIVLNLIDLSEELASQQIVLFLSELATYTQFYFLVVNRELTPYAKTYSMHIHTHFYDDFSEDYAEKNQMITRALAQMVVAHGNSIDDMLMGVRHHIENLPTMITGYAYTDIVEQRHELMDTAIIVATGPSLDKQLETLKKYAPYATVISLDASYPILAKHGIIPDYVTSIERVVETSSFFKNRYGKFDKDICFIVASLTHKQSIKNILPRKLVLTMRPQQSEILYDLKDYGYLGIGHSTANQAYQLAYALGHKNIVLIGQDLAFAPDGKSHATGHAFAQADEYIYVPAYGGEGEVRTTYVWEKFKNQYEADIEQAGEKGVKTYNCTEGGARIAGATEKGFSKTMSELLKDKKPKKLPAIQKVSDKRANKNLLKAYNFIQRKQEAQTRAKQKIESTFLAVVKDIDNIIELQEKGEITPKIFPKLVKLNDQIDKAKNFLDRRKIKHYVETVLTISVYYQELELAKISVAPSDTAQEKTDKLAQWIKLHKYWLFSLAGGLNAEIETTRKASKNLIREMKKRGILPVDSKI